MKTVSDRQGTRFACEYLHAATEREGEIKGVRVTDWHITRKSRESAIDAYQGLKSVPPAKVEIKAHRFQSEAVGGASIGMCAGTQVHAAQIDYSCGDDLRPGTCCCANNLAMKHYRGLRDQNQRHNIHGKLPGHRVAGENDSVPSTACHEQTSSFSLSDPLDRTGGISRPDLILICSGAKSIGVKISGDRFRLREYSHKLREQQKEKCAQEHSRLKTAHSE